MAILKKSELFDKLHAFIGDDTSEEAIGFMEDVTDTYNDMESRANGDGENWKQKYYDNDAAWKAKYRHRFFSSDGGKYDERDDEPSRPTADTIKVEDLFTRKEN